MCGLYDGAVWDSCAYSVGSGLDVGGGAIYCEVVARCATVQDCAMITTCGGMTDVVGKCVFSFTLHYVISRPCRSEWTRFAILFPSHGVLASGFLLLSSFGCIACGAGVAH